MRTIRLGALILLTNISLDQLAPAGLHHIIGVLCP